MVAAVALASSTYAWFANNNKVTADGISLNAKSEGVMLIIGAGRAASADQTAEVALADKATSVTLEETNDNKGTDMYPTHPVGTGDVIAVNATDVTWKHRYSTQYDAAITDDAADETTVTNGDDTYYLQTSLWIGLDDTTEGASVSNLRVNDVAITGTDNTLLDSARVMLTDKDGKVLGVYKNGQYMTTDTSVDGTTAFVGVAITATAGAAGATGEPVIAANLSSGTTNAMKVNVYVYFDGRDASCTSENFSASDLSVSLGFTAVA